MSKPHHNLRVILFVIFYIVANLAFMPIGNLIEDVPFAFGMMQLTLMALLITVKYDLFATEMKKMFKKPMMHFTLFLVCCVLFSIVAMGAYLNVLGSSLLVTIDPQLNPFMFVIQSLMILLAFSINEVFFVKIMQSLDYEKDEQTKLMIGLAIYVLLRSLLFLILNPTSIVIGISYTIITGFCAVMLTYKNMSIMMYPLAVLVIGLLFTFI